MSDLVVFWAIIALFAISLAWLARYAKAESTSWHRRLDNAAALRAYVATFPTVAAPLDTPEPRLPTPLRLYAYRVACYLDQTATHTEWETPWA